MKTTEQLFSRAGFGPESSLMMVRPGMEADDALERAAAIIENAVGGLRCLSERDAIDEDLSGALRCLAGSLEAAQALVDSVESSAMRAKRGAQ